VSRGAAEQRIEFEHFRAPQTRAVLGDALSHEHRPGPHELDPRPMRDTGRSALRFAPGPGPPTAVPRFELERELPRLTFLAHTRTESPGVAEVIARNGECVEEVD